MIVWWPRSGPPEMALTDMLARAEGHGIVRAQVDRGDSRFTVTLVDGSERVVRYPAAEEDKLSSELQSANVEVSVPFFDLGVSDDTMVWFGGILLGVTLLSCLMRRFPTLAV